MDLHLVGPASLLGGLALFLHALRPTIPVLTAAIVRVLDAVRAALIARADAQRLKAETEARIEQGREDTARDLRAQRDAKELVIAERDSEIATLRKRIADLERDFRALADEFAEYRRKGS